MDETQMMHGRDWSGQDLAGWWLSEKLHGCRAYWDGSLMWSRGGCVVAVPKHWKTSLPQIALDGEIWAGYGQFKGRCPRNQLRQVQRGHQVHGV